ncbi:uncharacterized protein BKA55DRAFT_523541 [Fusarium redolens]|uniref:Uncharacterized protein n=1 Tax=Fusarium redolens TaxID=48865 RepID=A0A9P9G5K7_FUSRE|nr:uncharacterized protein BKA55DRAFT_523541 [Fusarium redolens]KAH7232412.1 hypothetical protein BKA55DRAFT_523541 [Fusarium redolens]
MGAPARPLQSTPTQFTMEDLRLYQHFVFHAYPPMPLKGEAVWKEVAAMSHNVSSTLCSDINVLTKHPV